MATTPQELERPRIGLRAGALLRSSGARHGAILGSAMLVAGALDYAVSVVAGRWLAPLEFGVFVAVTALLQVLLSVATTLRMVVAFYVADLGARAETSGRVGPFLRSAARWCGRWGLVSTLAAAALSPLLARALHVPGPAPLWAASAMVLMLFVREPALGALQGIQAFGRLGAVQVSQAILRLALAAGLIRAGGQAAGAILAQPLAAAGALGLAIPTLRPHLASGAGEAAPRVSRPYAVATLAGLALFGLLTNADALFVKLAYPPRTAGDFATVVTFEKMSLFLPWAISFVLFPKATQRAATGRDPRPLLLVALAAVLAPGLLLSAAYLVAPGAIVRAVFTDAYADPGAVLGLVSLAATLYAGVNIWLNFALSTGRTRFIGVLAGVVAAQAGALVAFARGSLLAVAAVMVAAGLLGNVAGLLTAWSAAPETTVGPARPRARAKSAARIAPPRTRSAPTRALAVALAALAAGYALLLGSLDGLPFQDLPNHVARAAITADLVFDGARRFGGTFSLHPALAPYLLHDLALAALVRVLGPYAAGRAWMLLALAALPVAVAVLLRVRGHGRHGVLLACVLSLYLGTDFTFLAGFTSYRLALAETLLTLAAWQVFLDTGSARAYAAFLAGVVVGYLLHLSAPFFTAIAGGALAILSARVRAGEVRWPVALWRRAAAGALPLAALVAWELHAAGVAPDGPTDWLTPARKLSGLFLPFHRYGFATEALLLALLAATVLLLARGWRRAWRTRAVVVPAALAMAFLAVYFATPFGRAYVTFIDQRALPLAWLCAVIAAVAVSERAGPPRWAPAAAAVLLATANLGVLAAHLVPANATMRAYREVAARVPEGATFVPIATRPRDGTTNPFLHAGNFATIERAARSPYLFSGGVTRYFVASPRILAPSEFWYQQADRPWDGPQLARAYRLVLAMKPLDRARLGAPVRVVAENRVAELLEVERAPLDPDALP